MSDLRHSPISRKLTLMNVLVSGVALLAACAAFLAYDQYTFRQSLVRNLSAEAQIVGSNSISALTFNDPQSAEETLSAFQNLPHIITAAIFSADGQLFAQYGRSSAERLATPGDSTGKAVATFRQNELVVRQPILFQGKRLGYVLIRSDVTETRQRLQQYGGIALLVLLFSLLPALLISSLFRRSVAEPIVELAGTAQLVSRERNYSVRATPTGKHDEVAVLIDAFNNMLAQIQHRDAALQTAQAELERRVDDRTRQLMAANRELEAFSYSVSHDLRGPLEVISGFSYILSLEHGRELDPAARECVQQIDTASRRMAELIDDLLNLSRVSTTDMHHERVDLASIAREITDQLCRQEPSRRVDFEIHDCDPVDGDSRLLRIVMENLLRNAWKYTSNHEQSHIQFGCERRRGKRVFYVRDDGAGFDPAFANRLFKPFQRLHSSTQFPGTGIGLATVQRIIARHGGEIWAEGAVEKGATFYFSL
jgi:signal transduction histidine kinase